MGLYSGGLIIGRIFESEILGAYFLEGLLLEFYGITTNSVPDKRGVSGQKPDKAGHLNQQMSKRYWKNPHLQMSIDPFKTKFCH